MISAILLASVQALFYLQDAGETNGLLPVLEEMDRRGESYEVWAGGTAEKLLSQVPWLSIKPIASIDRAWPRERQLPPEEIEAIVQTCQPGSFVTGVAFAFQGQLLDAFRQKGVRTFAFWDNLNETGSDLYFSTAQSVAPHADWVFVPSPHFSLSHTLPVGQPAIEAAAASIRAIDREKIRERLQLDGSKRTLVYFGGYGAEFDEGYGLFLQCIDGLDANILVQAHPKVGREPLLDPRVRVLAGEASTHEAMAAADVVLCHQSTASYHALAAGKPVLYLIPEWQVYESLALRKGLALRVSSPAEFTSSLEMVRSLPRESFFTEMDLPEGSVARMMNWLTSFEENADKK